MMRISLLLAVCVATARGQHADQQPLAAQAVRIADALSLLGEPLPAPDTAELRRTPSVERIQEILDVRTLVTVEINPESRVKVTRGAAKAELVEQGWRVFLVKVLNGAGITPVLGVDSPNAGQIANRSEFAIPRRYLDLEFFAKPPLQERLSGLEIEYRVLQIYCRDRGKREAKLIFSIGQGSGDLGFRSEADILFTALPAAKVALHVLDTDGTPTTASFEFRDARGRVYPSPSKRLAPDFFFQSQVYRAEGESVSLPPGDYSVECTRGPEYRHITRAFSMGQSPLNLTFRLQRWIDPAAMGWISGDHHIHAAGCSHYEKPTEGVFPEDMMRHIRGEDLRVGAVLTWGPGWYFQKTFFEGRDNPLSSPVTKMHYDVEISGFPSSHTGHLVLLGLEQQDYPGTKRIEDWPSWGIPVLRWAKQQGAVVGYPHTGWGLELKQEKLPTSEVPPFDGIGANEYIVSVTEGLPDFISAVDTPYAWELNIWYHTLNAGFRTRLSGETDFPCIYDGRVGLGRSYVRQTGALDYNDWIHGIREGRAYVSNGESHLLNFQVNGVRVGETGSEIRAASPIDLTITASVAALLSDKPPTDARALPYSEKPYWSLERARIAGTRRVPVELVVNGEPVAQTVIEANGNLRPVQFHKRVSESSWVALRILPSSHTNPVFVTFGEKPARVRSSIEWCIRAVEQCKSQKLAQIRPSERGEASKAYDRALLKYRSLL